MSYLYATAFAEVGKTLTAQQKANAGQDAHYQPFGSQGPVPVLDPDQHAEDREHGLPVWRAVIDPDWLWFDKRGVSLYAFYALGIFPWGFPRMQHLGAVRLAGLLVLSALLAGNAVPGRAEELPPLVWAADAEGGAPYISMDPEHPGKYVGFEVESGRGPPAPGRPADRIQTVHLPQPRLGAAARRFRFCHERAGGHARPA